MVWQTLLFSLHPASFSQFLWLLACSLQRAPLVHVTSVSIEWMMVELNPDRWWGGCSPTSALAAVWLLCIMSAVTCFFSSSSSSRPYCPFTLPLHLKSACILWGHGSRVTVCSVAMFVRRFCHCSNDTHFTSFIAAERLMWFTAVPSNGISEQTDL